MGLITKTAWLSAAVLAAGGRLALGAEGGETPSLFAGDLGNIIWSLITFIAVLVVLGKFAWRPILDALQKRERFIYESLALAKRDREEAEARLKEYLAKLEAAKAEATAIVQEGRRDAEVLKHKIEEDARAEASRILQRARREIEVATETAVKQLYTLSANLATDIASRILRKELNRQEHERLIDESLDQLQEATRS
jgi:F-type H+-transporting ATPase subunit b